MSTVHCIGYDYPLPAIALPDGLTISGECGDTALRGQDSPVICAQNIACLSAHGLYGEVESFVSKKYIYELSMAANGSCVEALRFYLIQNMKNESEAELWSIRLGGDYSQHYKTRVPLKNMSPGERDMAEDGMDWYKENYVTPRRRNTSVEALAIDDISFVLDHLSVCLVVKK